MNPSTPLRASVAETLARQIRRVATIREQTERLRGMPRVNVDFALLMIDAALEAGCKAAGVDDAVAQLAACQQLEAFEA
jgi:hypothetical protein